MIIITVGVKSFPSNIKAPQNIFGKLLEYVDKTTIDKTAREEE